MTREQEEEFKRERERWEDDLEIERVPFAVVSRLHTSGDMKMHAWPTRVRVCVRARACVCACAHASHTRLQTCLFVNIKGRMLSSAQSMSVQSVSFQCTGMHTHALRALHALPALHALVYRHAYMHALRALHVLHHIACI